MTASPRIAVVGAGIIGASIAWHARAAGASVTVVEAGAAGGVATPASFAWINASWGNPEPYFRLRIRSMAEWRRLAATVPGVTPVWCGGLCWDLAPAELRTYAREHAAWGYGIRPVDRAEAARIEPNLSAWPELALHVAEEGAVEPGATASALLADARRRGARLHAPAAVHALAERNGAVVGVETVGGRIDADVIVLAAGAGTAALAATVGVHVPMTTPPGLLVHSRPHPRLLNGLVLAPDQHVRQTAEGRLVAGADFGGTDPGADAGGVARALFARTKAMLRGADGLTLDFHTVGLRPTPADGFPVIGRAFGRAGLYLAVMHSGITLAPAVGLFASEELLRDRRDPLLAPYGPGRFV